MFILGIALIIFLPVAILPLAIKIGFTPAELSDMGVCLENIPSTELLPSVPKETVKTSKVGQACLFNGLSV